MTIVILRKNIEYLEADIFFITNRWTKTAKWFMAIVSESICNPILLNYKVSSDKR